MRLILIIIVCHLVVILALGSGIRAKKEDNLHRKVAVQTITLQPAPPPRAASPKPKPTPSPKPVAATNKPKAPPKPAKKEPAKKPQPNNQQKALSMMQSALAQMDKPTTQRQQTVGKLASESIKLQSSEVRYCDELIGYLQNLLTLPELGDVKLRLTLSRDGKVLSLNVLASANEKNRVYVEKTLPTLTLPPFGKQFQGEKEHAFPITLTTTR
ncbi:MAG: hypothetical protein K1000chlam4_00773 [Chlamydiae bacterium]|nr:hypothetical protein [Chlamydiota bacterium]